MSVSFFKGFIIPFSMTKHRRTENMAAHLDASATVIFVALCFGLNTLCTEGSLQDQYVGCYRDTTNQSTWMEGTDSSAMTIELCIVVCRYLRSTTYALLQNGRNCSCGDVLDVSSYTYACDTRCSGNNRQVCGGPIGSSSYVVYSVCPFGLYGTECNKTCHCKQQIPCNFVTGLCPNDCDQNWIPSDCNRETSKSLSGRYVGCYKDSIYRTLGFRWDFQSTCTIEICSSFCASNSFTYAGIENYRECYCGEVYNRYGESPDSNCNYPCDGDVTQVCGAWFNLSVYFSCPIGYFGYGCTSQCNCKNEQRCVCPRCVCSSGCKSGWMGNRCEFRNCLDNNGDCPANETCITEDLKFASAARCICAQGYHRKRLWETCTVADIDGCSHAMCDPATTICVNTSGNFICDCRPGYERIDDTSCKVMPSDPCTGGQKSSSDSHDQVYSVGAVVGAAIGSAFGSAVIFATILIVVILCRRRRRQSKQSKEVNQIQHKAKTDETSVNQIPCPDYDTLDRNLDQVDAAYTRLDHKK